MSDSPKAARRARRTVARHANLKSPNPMGQLAKLLAVALAVVLVSGVSTAAFYAWNAAEAVAASGVDIDDGAAKQLPPSIGEIEGGVNVLVVGTDSCQGQSTKTFPRCKKDPGGERNDVTMLVHISDNPRRVTVVSFPRDMLVPIPSCPDGKGGRYPAMSSQPLNATYMYGGLACTKKTVEALTGVSIQFAASVRWTGVINMSDAIGGVQVCVAGPIDDRNTGLRLKAGTYTLKGTKALQFLRIRHGIGDGSDLGRISNQQQFLSSMIRKLQSESVLSNPATLFGLANTAMQQVNKKQLVLSESLANPTRMVQIAMAVKDVPFKDIVMLQYPTAYQQGDGASKVIPRTEPAKVLFTALKNNKAIKLTGKASQGFGVEVKGKATTPGATPGASGSPSPTATTDPDADAVELPSAIAGQSADQLTCTVPQR